MKILFVCFANSEYFDGCQYAIVELSDEAKKEILERRELFQMVKAKAKDVWSLTFWDSVCVWFDLDAYAPLDHLTDEQASRLERDQYLVLPEGFEESEDTARTECDRMVVTDDGVTWKCIAKHTEVYVETRTLPFEVLL